MNKCNNCSKNVDDEIRQYFWDMIPEGSYFEFTCPYCETILTIEVEPIPEFTVLSEEDAAEIVG
jgi:hypothetical protein